MSEILVTVSELSAALPSPRPPVLLDVRWALGDPDNHQHYLDAHIPGAVFVDLGSELAGHGEPTEGRHPLPRLDDLQMYARRWGIDADSSVVVYDATGNMAAARAWWLLRWAGVETVRMLDGGLGAWQAAELPTRSGEETAPRAGDVTLSEGHLPTVTADAAATFPGRLLDARAGERYRGEVEPVDSRAGHIPGALSAPTSDNVTVDGTFVAPDVLRDRFAGMGIRPGDEVAVYCGSGVTAAHEIAALALAGIDAALFPGSWSAWSSDPARPVETGPGVS
ncbi:MULTISPECIES: sulfurtransferase [unclassified Rhodococcus (in: high G+C Gram-positive bacteria)]|uniref:sulfurtransferase n=1 Tax=unclassified Rhodococcus (in: high G+C Gram-positive bacteria) TaxID=192944 RepID=UPI0021BF80A1|nr:MULTISPECIES: sulfurtransferase [unclassified Rhodococcus (in: high G+C Gram-positive bacteria)]